MAAGGKRGTRPRGATWRRGERTDGAGRAQSSGAARQGAVEPARLLPYGDVELAAIPVHEEQGRRSGLVLVEHALHIVHALHVLTVDGRDDVARSNAGVGRGAIVADGTHDDAFRLVQAQRTGNIGRHVLDGQAEGTLVLSAGRLRAVLRVILHARHAGLQRHGLAVAQYRDRHVATD